MDHGLVDPMDPLASSRTARSDVADSDPLMGPPPLEDDPPWAPL